MRDRGNAPRLETVHYNGVFQTEKTPKKFTRSGDSHVNGGELLTPVGASTRSVDRHRYDEPHKQAFVCENEHVKK